MSRIKNTKRNVLVNSISFIVLTLITFFTRKVFLDFFPIEYFGLNALCNQLLGMLSLAELGIGSAMIYSLYKPLAENNTEIVIGLMRLYKKLYSIIAFIVLVLGLVILIFLDRFVKSEVPDELVYSIFSLYLVNSVVTYLIAYKRSLLYANQKEYLMTISDLVIKITSLVSQIIIIYVFESFILFVVTAILFSIIGNVYINYIVNKRYSYINDNMKKVDLPSPIIFEIKTNIKAIFMHKIGDFAIRSSDSLILAYFLNLTIVGIYSNYVLIFTAISTLLMKIFGSVTASVGNLIHSSNNESTYKTFTVTHYINFVVVTNILVGFYFLVNPFIKLWLGKEFIIGQIETMLLSISLYLIFMRYSISSFKAAGGIYNQDKYLPLFEALILFGLCFLLVPKFGLKGLFLSQIIASLTIPSWSKPYYVFKHVFGKPLILYYKDIGVFTLIIFFIVIVLYKILLEVQVENLLMDMVLKSIIIFVIVNSIIIFSTYRFSSFKYLKQIFNPLKLLRI